MLSLGWKAGPEQYGPMELLDYAVTADRAGFDMLDVSDHFHPWDESGQAMFSWTWLGAAAVKTERIILGTGVTCPILRYHPAVIAQAAQTLAVMSNGRAYLAVGTGESLNEYAATGEWPGYAQRQEMLAEAIDLIRELWTGEQVTYNGLYYRTRKAKLYTRSRQPLPLYISSLVPESAYFAGVNGDGLMTTGGKEPAVYRQILENFNRGASDAGRDPESMPRMIELNVAYTDDEQAALKPMQQYWAGTFIPALFNQKIYTPKLSAENGKAVGMDTMQKQMCISADPQKHIEFARQYIDLGFTHLIFHTAGPDQKEFLEGYGQDVLPTIREKNWVRAG